MPTEAAVPVLVLVCALIAYRGTCLFLIYREDAKKREAERARKLLLSVMSNAERLRNK